MGFENFGGKVMMRELEDSKDSVNVGLSVKKEQYEECIGCIELQDNISKANANCEVLKSHIQKLEDEKIEMGAENNLLKQKNEDLVKSIGNVQESENEKVMQLMTEIKVLECEKKYAEIEVEKWKAKCKELDELQLQRNKTGMDLTDMDSLKKNKAGEGGPVHVFTGAMNTDREIDEHYGRTGAPHTPCKHYTDSEKTKVGNQRGLNPGARKSLHFGNEERSLSPTTPGDRPPVGPIFISDSEDDLNRPKRKKRRVTNRVTSEGESDSDDNVPLSKLCKNLSAHETDTKGSSNQSPSTENIKKPNRRRRLIRLASCEERGILGKREKNLDSKSFKVHNVINETDDEDETEGSSDSDSMKNFIVNDSDVPERDSAANSDDILEQDRTSSTEGDSQNHSDTASSEEDSHESDRSIGFGEVLSNLRRERKDKLEWEYESDMLADFAKRDEFCMMAVCALFRQQTSEEQSHKATIVLNGRGFSQIHAPVASKLAAFLTDDDPQGDLTKTVEELEKFNPKGVELCRKYAMHYSKQLFEIYKNDEDPYFRP